VRSLLLHFPHWAFLLACVFNRMALNEQTSNQSVFWALSSMTTRGREYARRSRRIAPVAHKPLQGHTMPHLWFLVSELYIRIDPGRM